MPVFTGSAARRAIMTTTVSVDLAVTSKDAVILLHNEHNGTFKNVAASAGIKGVCCLRANISSTMTMTEIWTCNVAGQTHSGPLANVKQDIA